MYLASIRNVSNTGHEYRSLCIRSGFVTGLRSQRLRESKLYNKVGWMKFRYGFILCDSMSGSGA